MKRVSSGTATVYIFSGSKVIAEYDNNAAPTAPSREYVYGGSALLAKIDSTGTMYFHQDHLSNRVVTSATGGILDQMGHFPFGDSWYSVNNTTKWRFTSYERDAESNNDYAMARTYVNRLAFSSPDPLAGSIANPQSLNRYTYVLDGPTNLIDPSGLDCIYVNEDGTKAIVYRGDCLNDGDNGIFVDGTVNLNDPMTFDQANNTLAVVFSPDGGSDKLIWHGDAPDLGFPNYNAGLSSWNLFDKIWSGNSSGSTTLLQTKVFLQALGRNFLDEFKEGGCVNVFGKATADALNPFSPSLSSAGEGTAAVLAASKYNAAVQYAASAPNYLGGTGLIYPMKSSVVRSMLADANATVSIPVENSPLCRSKIPHP